MSTKSKTIAKAHPGKAFRGKGKKTQDPLPVPDRLKRLYTSLVAQIDGGHWKGAERTCDKILRISSTDRDALQTKLLVYLQTEQYGKALDLIDKSPAQGSLEEKKFEKAYALYRLKREEQAQGILNEVKSKADTTETDEMVERGLMHLEAQLNYRQGNYQVTCELYQQLLDSSDPSSEEHYDIQTNLSAAQTYLDFINSGYLQAIDDTLASSPAVATALKDIENLPPPPISLNAGGATTSMTVVAAQGGAAGQPTAKKVRVKRIPKGVVPGVTPPPDPERWIKKSQRSKPTHGKKGKGRATGATQGFTTESIDKPQTPITGGKGRKKK